MLSPDPDRVKDSLSAGGLQRSGMGLGRACPERMMPQRIPEGNETISEIRTAQTRSLHAWQVTLSRQ
jgi:hypothetical protein